MENNEPGIDMLLCNMSRKNIARPSLLVVVIYSFHTVCGDFSGGEEVIRSWKEDGSLVLLGFPLSDYSLHRGGGVNHQPASSPSGWEPRMQKLLGGVLCDFLSEGSSRSRNVIRPQSKNNQCPCWRWQCKAGGAPLQPALLPSSKDAARMKPWLKVSCTVSSWEGADKAIRFVLNRWYFSKAPVNAVNSN